ncbi:hypothetical protein [Pantoea sp. 18069]|uniref:hypothetical protein n=1 Tax=Pantoea sp. 18069 TaxID=2681415 RepID=UPI00135750E0|nr:hypothetical protein [Pantoea sp. 18069]
MKAQTGWPFARHVFPGAWPSALGAVLCVAALGLLTLAGRLPDEEAPRFYLQGAAMVAAGWWLLLGSRLCALVYQMAPLRLPGVWRTLWRGALLHLAASMALPLSILGWCLPAGVEASALVAALWLGSAAGMLIVSMPMAIPIVPLVIIMADWDAVVSPLFCTVIGALALCLSGLAWRWQLGRTRPALLAPFGVELGGSPLQLLPLLQQQSWSHKRTGNRASRVRPAARAAGLDLLAAFLGPSCQTLRQLYGRRGQWLTYLVFLGGAFALLVGTALWWPESEGGGVFFAAMMAGSLPMVMLKPAARLMALRRAQSAGLAELLLTPGMPPAAQLPAALMRQVLRCLGERLALVGGTFALLASLAYAVGPAWLSWWAGLVIAMLLLGCATAWLAWHGQNLNWWWSGTLALGLMLAIGSNVHMLAYANPVNGHWCLAWAGWVMLAVLVFWRLQRRGAAR